MELTNIQFCYPRQVKNTNPDLVTNIVLLRKMGVTVIYHNTHFNTRVIKFHFGDHLCGMELPGKMRLSNIAVYQIPMLFNFSQYY